MADEYGSINWMVSFYPTTAEPVAEIYDEEGNLIQQKSITCRPPLNCPFVMTDIEMGTYKAGVTYDGKRYYYVQGTSQITAPNDLEGASTVTVSETVTPQINITVDAT